MFAAIRIFIVVTIGVFLFFVSQSKTGLRVPADFGFHEVRAVFVTTVTFGPTDKGHIDIDLETESLRNFC